MFYEVRNHPIDTLNQQIKNDLIQSQKLEKIEQPEDEAAVECTAQIACKLKVSSVRQKIGYDDDPISVDKLTFESASMQVQRLILMLRMHRIILLFNDPNQDPVERYKFITSVFMDIELPPHPPEMQFCFIYDKLENDEVRDPVTLVGRVFDPFLKEGRIEQFRHLNNRIKLNAYDNLSEPELHYVVDRYKRRYEMIMNKDISISTKQLLNNRLHMKGMHHTVFCNATQCNIIQGNWHLELIPVDGTWRVVNIQIEGVEI